MREAILLLVGAVSLTASLPASDGKAQPKPHIILMVADDLGWNDVSWHNHKALTPHLDALAREGVLLEQSYVQPICTPTRAALMTGRYPYTIGRQQGVLWPEEPTGLTIKRKLLPQALKAAGYSTHAVGKWHLGFCSWDYTPTSRGFDTFWGYYTGAEDYYHHTRPGVFSKHPRTNNDFSTDFYDYDGDGEEARKSRKFGYDFRNNTETDYSVYGEYSTYVFSSYIENLLESNPPSEPLFLYLPFQSVHAPLQVPKNYTKPFAYIRDHERRIKLGMVSAMDEAVGRVVNALKSSGHYNNSIIVFTTDNGGPTVSAGNNWPLRGNKSTLWEGGTRGAAFVHSPLLPSKGVVSNKLIHVTDWFATLVGLGGGVVPGDTDGYDQWEAITTSAPSPRTEMIYNIDIKDELNAGVRMGDYKLLVGNPGPGEWTPAPEGDQTNSPLNSNLLHRYESFGNLLDALEFNISELADKLQELEGTSSSFRRKQSLDADDSILKTEVRSEDGDEVSRKPNVLQSLQEDIAALKRDVKSFKQEYAGRRSTEGLASTSYRDKPQGDTEHEIDLEHENDLEHEDIEHENDLEHEDFKHENDFEYEDDFEHGNDLVTVGDLGLQSSQYSFLGQLLRNDTTIWLFNIINDPNEKNNIARDKPDVVKILLGLIQYNLKDYVKPDILPNDPAANPVHWNNTWSPGWCHAK